MVTSCLSLILPSLSVTFASLFLLTLSSTTRIQQQKQVRNSINISNYQTQTLKFIMDRRQQFVIRADQYYDSKAENIQNDEIVMIRVVVHVYWKHRMVYRLPKQQEGQKNRLVIYHGNEVVEDSQFYYTWGSIIQHRLNPNKELYHKKSIPDAMEQLYKIVLISTSETTKMIELKVETPKTQLQVIDSKMTINNFSSVHNKLSSLQSDFRKQLGDANNLIEMMNFGNQLETYNQLSIYSYYSIGQSVLIVSIVILQVGWLRSLIGNQDIMV